METGVKYWFKQKAEQICKKLENSILSNKSLKCKVVYGPVQSRRLGTVIGINNLKQKACSYNCVYCPLSKGTCCSICSNYCLSPYELHLSVRNKLDELELCGKNIDYILFAGSGEPTLDSSLSKEIQLLREFGYKIAVFTNSSLLWDYNIQQNLMYADYVSIKIDTANEETWYGMNRPIRKLEFNAMLNGIKEFSKNFGGIITTETMLVKNYNDNEEEIEELSRFLNSMNIQKSYFMTPIYPTRESNAESPSSERLKELSALIKEKMNNSIMLCCPENEEFFATQDFENELLGLLDLHPIKEEAVNRFVKGNEELRILNQLLENSSIKKIEYNKKYFYSLTDDYRIQLQTIKS
ncbi:MAG: radical SAM protein [Melioribacteraceae bacterium]